MKGIRALVALMAMTGCKTAPADAQLASSADVVKSESIELTDAVRASRPGTYAQLSDGVTAYELSGPEGGAPVVLVHGVSGPMAVWDYTAPALAAAGYRVLRYDLFGRGLSDRVDGKDYDQDLFDRQLSQLLAKLEIAQPMTLVGSSMGGVVVAEFRNRHPDHVSKIAFLDPAGFPMKTPPIAKLINVPLLGDTIMAIGGDKLMKARNLSYFSRPDEFPAIIAAYESQLAYKGTRRAMLSTWRKMPLQSFDGGFAKVAASEIPSLLIWGRDDEAIPFTNAKAAAAILKCELVAIARSGHLPQVEAADATNAALIAFLAKGTAL